MQIKPVLHVCGPGSITGSAVAWHCCEAHVGSQRERANFDHMIPKFLKFSKLNLILSNRSTPLQIFISIRSTGHLPRYVKCNSFGTTFLSWLCCILSWTHTQVEPMDRFSRFIADTTCFRPRTILLAGVATISEFI